MRFLIALAILAGCDDSPGLQGFVVDAHRVDAHEPCPDVSGFSPEDWVDPGELERATAAGVRGCFLHLRLNALSYNRCTTSDPAVLVSIESIISTCEEQPPGFEGFTECFDVWASGTCSEIADSEPQCGQNLDPEALACP